MSLGGRRLSLLLCAACAAGPAAAGVSSRSDWQVVSPVCRQELKKYLLCSTISGLFAVCSNDQLMNSSSKLRLLFGCDDNIPECKKRCMEDASRVMNESVMSPCNADHQAMHGFSAPIDIFTVGQVNSTGAMYIPLPNIKGLGGPTLINYGDPGHCAEIPSAQYCVLSGALGTGRAPITFALGNCLPNSCTPAELTSLVATRELKQLNLTMQCDLVRPVGKARGISAAIEDQLGWGGIPVYYPNKIEFTIGAGIMTALCAVLAALVCAGTSMDWTRSSRKRIRDAAALPSSSVGGIGMEAAEPLTQERPPDPPKTRLEGFLNHWSLVRNGSSLLRIRPEKDNPFACLDAIRTFSMAQVILGHSYVYTLSSAGFANMEQFNPPHGLLGRFSFQLIPGCFYGVDSFFVMSGFLCAYSLQTKMFNRPENRTPKGFSIKYLQFLVFRYLRLIPAEMFCIAFTVNLLPQMGTGILWNLERPGGSHCYESAGGTQCGKYWWTNLLFLQDLDKYFGKCYGHTWYLANDFQMYMTAPFFSLAYSINEKLGWSLLGAGMLVGLMVPAIMTAQHNWVPEIIAGASKGFDTQFYMKPWCRCPAFFVGIALGWAWPSLLQQYAGRHQTMRTRINSLLWALLGLGLCFVATFGRAAFFQCDLASCFDPDKSPVPRLLQYLWGSFAILAWCVGLGIIMVLCFQNRFLPLIQGFLSLALWQPISKLSYSAYLIHTSVLIWSTCQKDSPISYEPSAFFFNFVSFTAVSLFAAFWVHMFVEKPANNLQMKLLGGSGE